MATQDDQSFAHHTRWVPMYHWVAGPLLLLTFIYAVRTVIREFAFGNVVFVLMAFAFLQVFFYSRAFALKVQDRLIRLEERLRMERLFPDDLKARIDELTIPQMVALRFAGDAELAELTRRVLNEKIEDRKDVKKLVKNWRADHARA